MKMGQGNIFHKRVSRILSTGGAGCLPQCMLGYPPRTMHPPPDQAPPQDQAHPPDQPPPLEQTPPRADTPPDQPPPPWDQAHPPGTRHPPPGKRTAAYGQRAAGTHPTGMHSCWLIFLISDTLSSEAPSDISSSQLLSIL